MIEPLGVKGGKGLLHRCRKAVGIHAQRAVQRIRRRVGRMPGIAAHLREQFVSDLHIYPLLPLAFTNNLPHNGMPVNEKAAKNRLVSFVNN